jgi:ectoine hydroxylase-related dioxygenase (phytanoyl-CoA dioxygenase family)
MPSAYLEGLAREARENGYFVTPALFTSDEVAALRSEILRLWNDDRACRDEPLRAVRPTLQHLHLRSPLIASLCHHPALAELVGAVVGPEVDMVFVQAFVKAPGGDARGRIPWHQDASFAELDQFGVNCWVALTKTNTASGALCVAPPRPLRPHHFNNELYFPEMLEPVDDGVEVHLDPGQVVAFTPYVPHSSGPNLSDSERIGVSMGYVPPWVKLCNGTPIFGARVAVVRRGWHVAELLRRHVGGEVIAEAAGVLEDLAGRGVDVEAGLRELAGASTSEQREVAINSLVCFGSVDEDPDLGNTFRD